MSIQLKRGKTSTIASSEDTLDKGQPLVDIEKRKLYVGDGTTKIKDLKSFNATNLEDGSGASALNQVQDGTTGTFDFTNKNQYATALDPSLTNQISYGGVGDFATSFGGKSQASGKRSFAAGTTTIAKGNYSAAFGDNSVALGNDSFAEGYETVAVGQGSHSEGNGTHAKGMASHSEGGHTNANAPYSHAEGSNTEASGESSHAEGSQVEVQAVASHGEGYSNKIKTKMPSSEESGGSSTGTPDDPTWDIAEHLGEFSHIEGLNNLEYGYASHVEGFNNKAYAHISHVEGKGNTAGSRGSTNIYSAHVEGSDNKATANNSHVEGQGNTTSGDNSHAEGEGNIAFAKNSHAGGYHSNAQGTNAFAHGETCSANGKNSFAFGRGAVADKDDSFVVGTWNEVDEDVTFAVGTGSSYDVRNTALKVTKDGYVQVNKAPVNNNDVIRKIDLTDTNAYASGYKAQYCDRASGLGPVTPSSTGAISEAIISVTKYGQVLPAPPDGSYGSINIGDDSYRDRFGSIYANYFNGTLYPQYIGNWTQDENQVLDPGAYILRWSPNGGTSFPMTFLIYIRDKPNQYSYEGGVSTAAVDITGDWLYWLVYDDSNSKYFQAYARSFTNISTKQKVNINAPIYYYKLIDGYQM